METACEFVLLSLKQLETVLSKIYMEMIQSMLASIIPLAMLISGLTEVQCKFFSAFAPDRRPSDRGRISASKSAGPWIPELGTPTNHITQMSIDKRNIFHLISRK